MITKDQVRVLLKKYQTNETTIFREYLQVLFLEKLYAFAGSRKIYFKGGTALHLIFKAPRFSEDLDFTAVLPKKAFLKFMAKVFSSLSKEEPVMFKERKTLAGKRFLMTASPATLNYKIFINLDFSFREKVLAPEKSMIETDYPVLFENYIYHLAKEEIAAEKIRAILTRRKGRDLFDLWYLLNLQVSLNDKLVAEKLKYYKLGNLDKSKVLKRIESFPKSEFILDLRPFVPLGQREKLGALFNFIRDFLKQRFK